MQHSLTYALRESDLRRIMGTSTHIVPYRHLARIRTIHDLFGNRAFVVILFEVERNRGHWTLLIRRPQSIEFFDSYGFVPDDELHLIPAHYRIQNYQQYPHLLQILYQSGMPIEYSPYHFQSFGEGVNTCGRWCILRWILAGYDIDDFAAIVFRLASQTHLPLDDLVTQITNPLL